MTNLSAGNLYGATTVGGNLSACGGRGCGKVFELSPKSGGAGCGLMFKPSPKPDGGRQETALHFFAESKDGAGTAATLTIDAAGNLYGSTAQRGTSNHGVVFK